MLSHSNYCAERDVTLIEFGMHVKMIQSIAFSDQCTVCIVQIFKTCK